MYIIHPRAYIACQRVAERPLRSYYSVAHLVTDLVSSAGPETLKEEPRETPPVYKVAVRETLSNYRPSNWEKALYRLFIVRVAFWVRSVPVKD